MSVPDFDKISGVDVLVIGGNPHHLGGVEAFCDRAKPALEARGAFRLHVIAADTAFLSVRRLPNYLATIRQIWKFRARRPDVVWLQYVNLPDLGFLATAKLAGLKVMVTPHLGLNWRSQANSALRGLSKLLLGGANRLALISPTQELELALPPQIPRSAIRNFLPEAIWQAEMPAVTDEPELKLIHSGRLSAGKGSFQFVEVCAALARRGIAFHANITGGADAETMARIHVLIEENGLSERVSVLGRVSDADLLSRLLEADVLVHLSTIDSYPLIVLESLACGVFPLCISLAGAKDMVETYDGALVSEAGAVEEAVEFLAGCNPKTVRAAARAAGLRVRDDYRWDNCAAALGAALTATAR